MRLSPSVPPVVVALCVAGACVPAEGRAQSATPLTVLGINWSTEDFPGSPVIDAGIRQAFRSRSDLTIDYFAEYLESDRFPAEHASLAFRDYIRQKYRNRRIDVVLAISAVALDFVLEHRDYLFPGVPVVFQGYAAPAAHGQARAPGVTGIVNSAGFGQTLALALKLHPGTERVHVIAESPGYPFLADVKASLAGLQDRAQLIYITETSVEDLIEAVAAVSGRSLILYIRYSREDPGRVLFPADVARLVNEAASVPVYGIADSFLGTGVVGGVMQETREVAKQAAAMVLRVLDGERPQDIPVEAATLVPQFDWRQLQRWGIDPSNLPSGSRIMFRDPTVWEQYRGYIAATIAIVAIQSLLIGALLAQRAKRRRAEAVLVTSEAALRKSYERIRELAGQLIFTRETERSRIARELHDNVGQQMALLSIDIDLLEREASAGNGAAGRVRALAERAEGITSDVRSLSHQLHPSRLETLGLVPALQGFCREISDLHGLEVQFRHHDVPRDTTPDVALSLFRIAQEALQNVAKHSGATRAIVDLSVVDATLRLEIADQGCGFAASEVATHGLGLLSMRERVHLVGGQLAIETAPGIGTKITVRLSLDSVLSPSVHV
jgi:signal transduction histidine kinase